jgi:glycine/D-amino acid oxidase-like deaminating enzyme
LVSPCEIVAIESASVTAGVKLKTRDGNLVTCRKAIFATGYEVIGGIPRSAFDIVSSWAIATQPLTPDSLWPSRCLIWEAADPYLYMRTTHDNRILIGGEDSRLLDPERRKRAIPNKSKKLLRKAQRILGRDDLEIDYAWAGAFADSPTGLPCFKQLDTAPGVFAVLGCGGNGITFSMIASQVVTAWLKGRTDPDADLFTGF